MRYKMPQDVLDFWTNFDKLMTEKQNAITLNEKPVYLSELKLTP